MYKAKIISILLFVLGYFGAQAQVSNMLIARNAVGKLQEAIQLKKSTPDQLKIINDGLSAVDIAKDDRKTKKWPETWAIKSYLSSYIVVLETDTSKVINFINKTLNAIDTAQLLDKAGDNAQLTKAASYNVNMKMQDLGNQYFKDNDFGKSYKYLHQVSDFFPNDTTAAINTGLAALNNEMPNAVVTYFKRAIDNQAKSPDLFLNLAKIHETDAHAPEALEIVKDGLRKNPFNKDLIAYQINLMLDMGEYDDALAALKSASKQYKKDKLFYYLQGQILQQKNDLDNAIEAYQKAINLDSYYLEPIYQLGLIYVGQANDLAQKQSTNVDLYKSYLQNAITEMQRANEIEPDNKNTIEILAKLYDQMDIPDKAMEYKNRLDNMF